MLQQWELLCLFGLFAASTAISTWLHYVLFAKWFEQRILTRPSFGGWKILWALQGLTIPALAISILATALWFLGYLHIASRTAQATTGQPTFQNELEEEEKKPQHINGASWDMLFDWEYVACTVGDGFLFEVDDIYPEGCVCTLRHPKSPRSVAGWMSIDETVAMLLARKRPPCPPATASLKQRLAAPKKKQG